MRYAIFFLAALFLLPNNSLGDETAGTISVSGTATITAEAEFAVIHAQLKVTSATVEESYMAVTHALTEIAAALQPLGVTKADIITSAITQGAEYTWKNNIRDLIGYSSACTLKIKLNAIADTFRIHAKLATFQNLSTGATDYGRNDEAQLRITALQQALLDARLKAQAMAETLGVALGSVRHVKESTVEPYPMVKMAAEARLASAPSDPGEVITAGAVTVSGNVMVEFGLE